MKKNNETKDFFKNILSKSHNNNVKASPKKINIKSKLDFFQKRMPKIIAKKKYKTKTELENEQYQNIENLYNKALHLKSKSFDDQVELENYLLSSKRNNKYTNPRHICMYILKTKYNLPYKKIGYLLGGRDHTTVISAVEKISLQLKSDKELSLAVNTILKKIN